jgi:hypothetical protein
MQYFGGLACMCFFWNRSGVVTAPGLHYRRRNSADAILQRNTVHRCCSLSFWPRPREAEQYRYVLDYSLIHRTINKILARKHGRSQGPGRVGSCPGLVSTKRPITPSFASLNSPLTCNSMRHKARIRSLVISVSLPPFLPISGCATVSPDLHLAAAYSQRTCAP